MLLCDAAERAGVSIATMWKRLHRGWSANDLFNPAGTYTVTRQGVPITKG